MVVRLRPASAASIAAFFPWATRKSKQIQPISAKSSIANETENNQKKKNANICCIGSDRVVDGSACESYFDFPTSSTNKEQQRHQHNKSRANAQRIIDEHERYTSNRTKMLPAKTTHPRMCRNTNGPVREIETTRSTHRPIRRNRIGKRRVLKLCRSYIFPELMILSKNATTTTTLPSSSSVTTSETT